MSLYREHILDHYKHPRNFGTMENADVSFSIDNPLCGDRLTLYLKFIPFPFKGEGGPSATLRVAMRAGVRVADAKFTGAGCAVSVASASMLTEYLKNKTRSELLAVSENDIYDLLGIPISAARIQCALLSLNALKNILLT